jgi:hypothetical protein
MPTYRSYEISGKPALLIELQDNDEITDDLIKSIHALERNVVFTKENIKANHDIPMRIRLTKDGLKDRIFDNLYFQWKTEGLKDEMFENADIQKSLYLGTPIDKPFDNYPTHIARLAKNSDFNLQISGFGIPIVGNGFNELIDVYRKNLEKPIEEREKLFHYTFYV